MTWFKVDDKLHAHKKSVRAGVDALGLWVLAGSWCADQLTDGFVPDYIAERLDPDYVNHAALLVRAGLWLEDEHDGDRGWRFHDWADHQPTKDKVEERREAERERKAAWREAKSAKHGVRNVSRRDNPGTDGGTDAGVPRLSPLPDPTRPDPTRPVTTNPSSSPAAAADDPFDAFWNIYPRKVGKDGARKAFAKAAKSAGAQTVIAGARRFAADPNLPEKNFIPHPATWLNRGGWEDEPLPPRLRVAGGPGERPAGGGFWDTIR